MVGRPWRAIASVEIFFRGPLCEGPNFCKFCITPTTDFIGKENLKVHTGVPSLPSPPLSLPCLPVPPPSYTHLHFEVRLLKSSSGV